MDETSTAPAPGDGARHAAPAPADGTDVAPRLPRRRERPVQRGRTVLTVLFVVVALVGAGGVLFIALRAGDLAGAGLSIGLALVPLPLLWLAYWWLDRYEPEPRRYKMAAFVWGAVGAVAIALAVQIGVQAAFGLRDEEMASIVAPLSEEPAKGLFLLLTFLRWRRIIDGFLDGLVVAGIVGLGFAFVENIGYYAISYLGAPDIRVAGAEGATSTFVVRGIFSPFAHPLFLSAFGISIGVAVALRSRVLKVLVMTAGMAVSIALHGLWNASLSYGGGAAFVLVYLVLGALLLGLGVMGVVLRVGQVRTLERSLSYVAERGWIHPAEIPFLSRFGHRKAARSWARAHHGKVAEQAVTRYQRIATEMAFLHDAVMTGRRKPHGVERVHGLLDEMHALRPLLRLPPALMPLRPR